MLKPHVSDLFEPQHFLDIEKNPMETNNSSLLATEYQLSAFIYLFLVTVKPGKPA